MNNIVKVLIINTVEFKLNGITAVIMNYYKKMDKSDMQIDFITINDVDLEYIEEFKKNNSRIYTLRRKKNPLSYFINLFKLMKKNHYDIIHIHGNSATVAIETVAAYLANIPVRIVHSHNTTCNHKKIHNFLYPIMKRTYTHGIACGEDAGKWLFRNEPFEVMNNGIDLDKFIYNANISKEYKEKINFNSRKIIGHIGNFVYQKNHEFLINSFNELIKKDSGYLLLLIGEGVLLNDIKEKVNSLGLNENVLFLGKTTEVNKYLQAIDIFVLPSHFEGVPVVLIEAQSLGLPCYVSDKVSTEAKLTDLIEFLPIDDTSGWVNKIINTEICNREEKCNKSHKIIDQVGYNVTKNAYRMKGLYEQYLMDSKKVKM